MRWLWVVLVAAGCATYQVKTRTNAQPPGKKLRTLAELGDLKDAPSRSRAAFAEASKVLLHPRCVNCHPPDDTPRQRELQELHDPPVVRGPDDHGPAGMQCATCHQNSNVELARVPGAPNWHLAPLKMAWLGRTPMQICAQLKDREHNGGKTLAQIVEHMEHDELVGWAWNPGSGREPAPGTQKIFGQLMAAWADNGAVCEEETR